MSTSEANPQDSPQPAQQSDRDASAYVDTLEAALEKKRNELTTSKLPDLQQNFVHLHGSFKQLYTILIRKSLVAEDPYKNQQKISEIEIPENTPIIESELSEQISIRLSQYDNQLDFLGTYYQFSLDYLTLKRIKLLAKLAKFINWDGLSETSSQSNTRTLAILIGKIRGGGDNFSSQVVVDAQNQLSATVGKILSTLKEIALYHRETYKYSIRLSILADESLPSEVLPSFIDPLMDTVRKAFSQRSSALPFYQDLVREVLIEDCTLEGPSAKREVLANLEVAGVEQKKPTKVAIKPLLMESIRLISAGSQHLESALEKINANAQVYEVSKAKNESAFRRWLQRVFARDVDNRVYSVEFVDVVTSATRVEHVDFDRFLEEGVRLAQNLASLSNKMSPRFARLAASSDEEIFKTLERLIIDLQKYTKTLPALHEFVSSELSREMREKLRGIRMELNALQNAIVKTNQKRHEYLAQREEEAQLKKLGIGQDQAPGL